MQKSPNTPRKRREYLKEISGTPVTIPASPLMQRLGYGTGVQVFRFARSPKLGNCRSPWAIKKVDSDKKKNPLYSQRLKLEAEILRKLSHPNIVGFRAFTETSLVMEDCEKSLGQLLEDRDENDLGPLECTKILKVCLDSAKGLDYLHRDAKLLHGDLKSYNILIKGDFIICKLCDFGVSLPLDQNGKLIKQNETSRYVGTTIWAAPETFGMKQIVTDRADIYSYGLTIWEMFALSPPIPPDTSFEDDKKENTPNDNSMNSTLDQTDASIIEISSESSESEDILDVSEDEVAGERPALPTDLPLEEYNKPIALFYACTERDLEKRPSAYYIVKLLED